MKIIVYGHARTGTTIAASIVQNNPFLNGINYEPFHPINKKLSDTKFDKKELEKDVEYWGSNLELKVNSREERLGQIYPRYKDKCYEGELIPVVISFPDLAERVIGVNELADLYNISKSKYAKKLLIHTSLENECDSVRSLAQEHLGYSDFRLGIYKNINKLKGIRENGDLAKGIFFGGVLAFLFYEFYILLRNIAE